MEQNNNDIIYTAADIEKYHQGLLSPKEMHALEKAALDDPFLADALEGYKIPELNSNEALAELRSRIAERVQAQNETPVIVPVQKMKFPWWKIAAMFILVAGAAFTVYRLAFNNTTKEIAQNPKVETAAPARKDTGSQNAPAMLRQDSNTTLQLSQETTAKTKTAAVDGENPVKEKAQSTPNTDRSTFAETNAAPEEAKIEAKKKEDHIAAASPDQKKSNARVNAAVESREQADVSLAVDSANAHTNAPAGMAAKNKMTAPVPRNIFKGRITDASNNPLPFSNVTNIEDNIGTYSDAKGNFILTSTDTLLKVQVSSVGFETSLIELHKGVPAHAVTLNEDPNIPEVVIARSKVNTKRIRLQGNTPEEAEPQDGWDNYDTYLVNNTQLPAFMKDANQKSMGEVELSFEVDKEGKPQNIAVKKSLCSSCDKEAIRLVREGPRWKRKAKKVKATVNIAF